MKRGAYKIFTYGISIASCLSLEVAWLWSEHCTFASAFPRDGLLLVFEPVEENQYYIMIGELATYIYTIILLEMRLNTRYSNRYNYYSYFSFARNLSRTRMAMLWHWTLLLPFSWVAWHGDCTSNVYGWPRPSSWRRSRRPYLTFRRLS